MLRRTGVWPLIACALAGWLHAATASATNFTWRAGGTGAATWSNGSNWVGEVAPPPSSTIGTLTFPLLSATTNTDNDLSGLTIESLVVNDTNGYGISGESLTLGSGGLSITGEENTAHFNSATITAPIVLAGNQAWDISSVSGHPKQAVGIGGGLTGASADLTVNMAAPDSSLTLGGPSHEATANDDEIGNTSVKGEGAASGDDLSLETNFNSSDGHTLSVEGVVLQSAASIGPLEAVNSIVETSSPSIGALTAVGSVVQPNIGTLHVASASLDASSTLGLSISGDGTQAGVNYTQITSGGTVALGGATLALFVSQSGTCPPPPVGQTYTLITTTGAVTGTFSNAANGSTLAVVAECFGEKGLTTSTYNYRVNYNTGSSPETVTATFTGEAAPKGGSEEKGSGSGSTTGGGAGTSSGTSTPSTGSTNSSPTTATISSAQIAASLGQQLIPSGKAAKIAALFKDDGITMTFRALEGGTLVIQWYELPAGAKLSKKAKPVLVASGQAAFSTAGTGKLKVRLTVAGKRLLEHAKRVRLTVKGVFTPQSGNVVSAARQLVVTARG